MKILLQEILDDPNSVLALCAVLISIISLFIAFFSAYQNRLNNRLSKLPIGYILPLDYEEVISVTLQNNGTGPLITTSIEFSNGKNVTKNALIDFMPTLSDNFQWETFSEARKIILKPSDTKVLIKFKGNPSDVNFVTQRDEIRKALADITIKVNYKSVFNECRSKNLTYKLTWFNRIK
jgi:hypothetical protein